MSRRTILAVLGWLTAAAVATLIGVGATELVGASITGTPHGVRSQQEITRALAVPFPTPAGPAGTSAGEPPPGPTDGSPADGPQAGGSAPAGSQTVGPQGGRSPAGGTPTAASSAPARRTPVPPPPVLTARRALTFGGGIAVAECTDAGVRLVSWAPAQGYRVADVNSGPDKQVSVDFEGPDRTYAVKIVCVNGQPEASVGSD